MLCVKQYTKTKMFLAAIRLYRVCGSKREYMNMQRKFILFLPPMWWSGRRGSGLTWEILNNVLLVKEHTSKSLKATMER